MGREKMIVQKLKYCSSHKFKIFVGFSTKFFSFFVFCARRDKRKNQKFLDECIGNSKTWLINTSFMIDLFNGDHGSVFWIRFPNPHHNITCLCEGNYTAATETLQSRLFLSRSRCSIGPWTTWWQVWHMLDKPRSTSWALLPPGSSSCVRVWPPSKDNDFL